MRSALIRETVFRMTAQGDNALINTEETAGPFTLSDTIQFIIQSLGKARVNIRFSIGQK